MKFRSLLVISGKNDPGVGLILLGLIAAAMMPLFKKMPANFEAQIQYKPRTVLVYLLEYGARASTRRLFSFYPHFN